MVNNDYLEAIKKKLDALNKASGTNPAARGKNPIDAIDNYNSQDDIFGVIGAAGMKHKENFTQAPEMPQKDSPNTGIIYS